jgi:hypothetical protein
MATRFADFAATNAAASPYLPVVHTTDWLVFRDLMEVNSVLQNVQCPVFGEDLLYLFYGKPCYRMHAEIEPTSLSAFYLISILFEPHSIGAPRRVLPFDSGAFAKGLYAASLHPRLRPLDFELNSSIQGAAQAVATFYGSNAQYFSSTVRNDIPVGTRDIEAEAFLSIIRTPARTPMDDRRSAIEIQLRHSIDIRTADVCAVILPEVLLDDPLTEDFILKDLNAKPLGYYCTHARPAEDVRAMMIEAKRYYKSRGLL